MPLGSSAGFASTRITQGDAQAVLDAFGPGGTAVFQHNSVVLAGPGDLPAAIRPFNRFNGIHECSLDWHTIALADIEGGDQSFTEPQAEANIDQVSITLFLDGQQLQLTQTPVQRFNNPELFGVQVAYYSQFGQVRSPSSLAIGSHTLRGVETFSGSVVFDNTITFYVDPPNTGACS